MLRTRAVVVGKPRPERQQEQQQSSPSQQKQPVEILLPERVAADYGLYTWPCAARLAELLWSQPAGHLNGKMVLELGAGTGLPGLVAARLGAAGVVLSDRARDAAVLDNMRLAVQMNNLQQTVNVVGINWGEFSPAVVTMSPPDIILAADCFYDREDYDALLATMVFFLEQKRSTAYTLTAYQHRTGPEALMRACGRWGLHCEAVGVEALDDKRLLDADADDLPSDSAHEHISVFRISFTKVGQA
eukprot:m.221834 g.221834  ORF g.221834 m.221834 type:complete len:245 (+) comp72473_c0_seq1:101-835(+)